MYLLAHSGITLGAAYAIENAVNCRKTDYRPEVYGEAGPTDRGLLRIDYRFILLGSLLPDIIDKPLGLILLPGILANGRTFLHTLIFLSFAMLAAVMLYRLRYAMCGIYVAFGVLTHFIMDAMWADTITFYWFLYGAFLAYPRITFAWIVQSWIQSLLEEPRLYLPEIAGLLILLFFTARIIIQKQAKVFFLQG